MNWKTLFGIAVAVLVLALVVIFLPLEDWLPEPFAARMDLIDTILSIIGPIISAVFFFFGIKEYRKEKAEQRSLVAVEGDKNIVATGLSTALGEGAQQITGSTLHGDVVGPGGSSRSVNIKGKVDGSTIITGDNNRVEKK
jgi:hypothetical protein